MNKLVQETCQEVKEGRHFLAPFLSSIQKLLTFHLNKHVRSVRPSKSAVLVTSAAKKCNVSIDLPIVYAEKLNLNALNALWSILSDSVEPLF